jgi:peptidoglycan/xylan/chitin deacetylase (PgdA/CDA1 family)
MGSSSTKRRPLQTIKRGFASLFVCTVVAFPLLSIWQWGRDLNISDSRKATPLAAMNARAIDKSGPAPAPFTQPLITVTFDDGWESVYTVAAPILQKYGIPTTQYIISGVEAEPNYMSWKQIDQLQKAGHEIACHTVNHPDLTALDNEDLIFQLSRCKATLSQKFGPIYDFASPYGATNSRTIDAIKKYYRSQRNTNGDAANGIDEFDVNVKDNFDPYNIIAVTVHRETSIDTLKALVDYAKAHNGWLILNYHQVDDSSSDYGLDPVVMEDQLKFLASTNVRMVTMGTALEYIYPAIPDPNLAEF